MPIINREFDASEQIVAENVSLTTTVTGKDYAAYIAPRPQLITNLKFAATGVSNAMTMALWVQRAGVSAAIGGALTLQNVGTSSIQSYSLPATGSSLLVLQTGDALSLKTAVSNGAADGVMICLVVKNLQDIKNNFGA